MTLLHNSSAKRRIFLALALLIALSLLAGCAQTGQMVYMPRYDVYEPSEFFADGSSARQMPPGTVAQPAHVATSSACNASAPIQV